MEQQELLSILNSVASGISKLLGTDTEVVLHDLEKAEIAYIYNGYITGREAGYKMNPTVYSTVLELLDENDHSVGYASHSAQGKNLRSSHFLIRNPEGEPKAMICINQDTSKIEQFRNYLGNMIAVKSLSNNPVSKGSSIPEVTRQIIIDIIEEQKPTSTDGREAKMKILQKLESRGVFLVKDSVPIVCKLLSISQATLYNYLRDIRSGSEAQAPAAPAPVQLLL